MMSVVSRFDVERLSWSQLLRHAHRCRSRSKESVCRTQMSHFHLRISADKRRARIYCLGPPKLSEPHTILYVDLVVPQLPLPNLLQLHWKVLLEQTEDSPNYSSRLSKEEELLRERMRSSISSGISDYEIDSSSGRLLFSSGSSLFTCHHSIMDPHAVAQPICLPNRIPSAAMDPQMCPGNEDLFAFVCQNDIYLLYKQVCRRVTFARDDQTRSRSAGTPSFIIQEEFDRYSAMWWAPNKTDPRRHLLLYEEIDETDVHVLEMSAPATDMCQLDQMAYPLAGTSNARITIRLLDVRISEDQNAFDVSDLCLCADLSDWFPWYEYVVRAGWMPEGDVVWLQLMSRTQKRLALIHVPIELFADRYGSMQDLSQVIQCPTLLLEESTEHWINYHDNLYFLKNLPTENSISFIWSSECSGYCHLYIHTCLHHGQITTNAYTCKMCEPLDRKQVAITCGEWQVSRSAGIEVDEDRGLVYFLANKDNPIESHVYVSSYVSPGPVSRLTDLGQSHCSGRWEPVLRLQPDLGFVCWRSSLTKQPTCVLYLLQFSQDSGVLPSARVAGQLSCDTEPADMEIDRDDNARNDYTKSTIMDNGQMVNNLHTLTSADRQISKTDDLVGEPPQLIKYMSRLSGYEHYALLYRPKNWRLDKKYPVLMYVYGGPEIQLIKNVWSNLSGFAKYTSLGYAVVVVDGRGSANRGLNFEAMIKECMGTIEIEDQVEGLLQVNKHEKGLLDLTRVGVTGWSYGGYVSLLALIQRPDIFKLAIAGGPVTSWNLYDTGYTERYMGLPSPNNDAYKNGSVVAQTHKFPDESGRLLLLHGLIDENVHFRHTEKLIDAMTQAGKPYQLQIYPRERHGVRCSKANEHMDATVLDFLQSHLC